MLTGVFNSRFTIYPFLSLDVINSEEYPYFKHQNKNLNIYIYFHTNLCVITYIGYIVYFKSSIHYCIFLPIKISWGHVRIFNDMPY